MKESLEKNRDVVPYILFGVLTTLVNVGVYWLCAYPLRLPVVAGAVVAWGAAVLFAYLTNRRWVFRSGARTSSKIAKEAACFFACRLATGILDWGVMHIFVSRLRYPDMPVKMIANILVILLNYIAGKWLIFKEKPSS